jgi:membrane protein YdbS with pleckstrin-like domain
MSTHYTWWLLIGKWLLAVLAIVVEIAVAVVMVVLNWPMVLQIILDAVLFVLMLIPLSRAVVATIIQTHTELVVTNRRVVNKTGVFRINTQDIPLKMVINVDIDQSFLGRILNYGDITISTAAKTYTLVHIKHADYFRDAIISELEKYEVDHYAMQAQALSRVIKPSNRDSSRKKGKTPKESARNIW